MPKYLIALTALLITTSTSISALDKITITGQPVMIQKTGDVYVPATTLTTQDYYYLSSDKDKMVCYRDVQPSLASVDAGTMSVRIGDTAVDLHCYKPSDQYFIIQ